MADGLCAPPDLLGVIKLLQKQKEKRESKEKRMDIPECDKRRPTVMYFEIPMKLFTYTSCPKLYM